LNSSSTSPRRLLALFGIASAFGLASTWWLHHAPPGGDAQQALQRGIGSRVPAHPGEPVPGVDISSGALLATSLPDIEGKAHSLGEWTGHPLVLNFWATWCDPCREELPLLTAAAQRPEFHEVTVVGIALDDVPAVRDFVHAHPLGFPVLVEDKSVGQELAGRLGDADGALPFTALVDRHGNVVETRLGPWKAGELEARLAALSKS
jgi:thiol-disulfide isomerase/thioredoxin